MDGTRRRTRRPTDLVEMKSTSDAPRETAALQFDPPQSGWAFGPGHGWDPAQAGGQNRVRCEQSRKIRLQRRRNRCG